MLETTSGKRRTALVTGAGGDLAATVVPRLAATGWLVAASVRPGTEERVMERFAALGGAVTVVGVDLAEPEAVAEAVGRLERAYGAPEALIHLAGRFEPGPRPADGVVNAAAVLERALDGNLRSAVNACAAVLPGMLAAGRGALVAVGAAAGASPAPGSVAYAAAKGALAAYFRSLAAQVAKRGVNVALLVPKGALDTPGNRRAMPDADPAAWIAPDALTDAVLFLLDRPPRGLVHELPLSVG